MIEGQNDTAAAAYFSSWFGLVAAALHYAISVYQAAPDFSLSNLVAELIPESGFTRAFGLLARVKPNGVFISTYLYYPKED
ncbi:hypothetical protein P4V54_26520 [Brevibacillus nitrificans]|uniref:hypothetical protein n=1 Tax=Brevibacillus nitrificans TaxID=651560 RepID=UPI002E219216|nr:hypothetical protein [Brevibacillus nitrificans]